MGRRPSDIEKLPPHVSAYSDRHGKRRYRYRKTGAKTYHFKGHPGTPRHPSEEYKRVAAGEVPANDTPRAKPGTIDDLVMRWYGSADFNSASERTRTKNRAIIEDFRCRFGTLHASTMRFSNVETILVAKAKKNGNSGGPFAAQRLRKLLRRLFELAMKLHSAKVIGYEGMTVNPVELADAPAVPKTKGFHTWSDDEIAQFRATHPVGTKARMALELLRWTLQRGGDARTFSPKQRKNGHIEIWNEKTDKYSWVPEPAQLTETIEAMTVIGTETLLVTQFGKPFTEKGFSNWFKKQCVAAGLPHCTAHGVRKSTARQLVDHVEATQQELKAAGNWSQDREVATYVKDANQKKLAGAALTRLAEWDLANHGSSVRQTKDLGD
jgi:integrase